jgi:hypothetical protein
LSRSFIVATRTLCQLRRDAKQASADVLDDLDELVDPIAVAAGEVDQLLRSLDDRAAFGRSCDGDPTAMPELEDSSSRRSRGALARGTKERDTVLAPTPPDVKEAPWPTT